MLRMDCPEVMATSRMTLVWAPTTYGKRITVGAEYDFGKSKRDRATPTGAATTNQAMSAIHFRIQRTWKRVVREGSLRGTEERSSVSPAGWALGSGVRGLIYGT